MSSLDKDRLKVLLYNTITLLQDQGFEYGELLEELGITSDEYQEVMEDDNV